MKKTKKLFKKVPKWSKALILALLLIPSLSYGQDLSEKALSFQDMEIKLYSMMDQDQVHLEEVQHLAEQYFAKVGTGKGTGYKHFKRWEHHAKRTLQPDGKTMSHDAMVKTMRRARSAETSSSQRTSSNWIERGPLVTPTPGDPFSNRGIGRILSMAVYPANEQMIYAAAYQGGLWKTTNGGNSWSPLGDQFDDMRVESVVVQSGNANIVYYGDASGGVYKSTNGGTSFSLLIDLPSSITDIKINPNNTNQVFVSNASGVYRSTNGGASWSGILSGASGNFEDLAFKPGSSSVLYASGRNRFIRSTNEGDSWSVVNLPVSSPGRLRMAVTAANSNYVYLFSGAGHVLRSTNSGASFTLRTQNFSLVAGQSNHNLGIAANPNNANEIYVAGVAPVFRSVNGGTSFSGISSGNVSASNYVHADVMNMEFVNSTLYVGSDGGLYKRNTSNGFDDLSTGLGAQLFYFINSSATDREVVTSGTQDNGSHVSHGPASEWINWFGGDGGDGAVHPTEPNIIYGTLQFGHLFRSTDGGFNGSFNSVNPPPENGQGSFIDTPIEVDLNAPNRVYIGYDNLYRHESAAAPSSNWINATVNLGVTGGTLTNIATCPSNSNRIYITNDINIYRSLNVLDNTPSWLRLVSYSTQTYGSINHLAVNPYDENRLVIATSSGAVLLSYQWRK